MDEKQFVGFVMSEAQRHETPVLREIVDALYEIVKHRTTGKPKGLRAGSIIHAVEFGFEDYRFGNTYGEVIRVFPKSCVVQEPGSRHTRRVSYSKCAIEFVTPEQWAHLEERVRKDNEERAAQVDREMRETYGETWEQLSDEEFEAIDARLSRTNINND